MRGLFIPVHNFSNHSIRIPDDTESGALEPFSESLSPDPVNHATCAKVLVDGPGYHEKDHPARLINLLDLSNCDCSAEQLGELKVLLAEHSTVFELDSFELGHSTLVQHHIDIGESAPLKQPYRTPIVQRDRISQLIKEIQKCRNRVL